MFAENFICGFKNDIGYEVRYPCTNNLQIDSLIKEIVEDMVYYFENSFGERVKSTLKIRKRGKAYGELYTTYFDGEYYSFVILMGGFEGNELTVFEYVPLNVDKNGGIIPLSMYISRQRKNRPYFLGEEKTVCLTEEILEFPRIKIRKSDLFELVKYKILS